MDEKVIESGGKTFNVRLQSTPGGGADVVLSYEQTRLFLLEYDNVEDARHTYRVISDTVKNVIQCMGILTSQAEKVVKRGT